MKRYALAILFGVILTPVLFLLSGMAGGTCHCNTPLKVFFPYGSFMMFGTRWESASLVLIALQFPIYAVLLAAPNERRKRALIATSLLALHAVTAVTTIFTTRR